MSAQLVSLLGEIKTYLPWVSLLAGVGGSLHCVGMCGGLVTSSCQQTRDVFRYQAGRLMGYLLLGVVAGMVGNIFDLNFLPDWFSIIPSLLIGFLLIYWGLQTFRGKKAEVPTPKFMGSFYTRLWQRFVRDNKTFSRSFFTGLISIMLPCGLLYGIVISTVALESTSAALTSMFFFWLGTLPSMIAAPVVVRKILSPFKSKLPKTYAITLVTIGIITITMRIGRPMMASSHHPEAETKVHKCH